MFRVRNADILYDLEDLKNIIQKSFKTVAEEFDLTEEKAPTNPAYITPERIQASVDSGAAFFIGLADEKKAGCIALEIDGKKNGNYFIERLAVLPEFRHRKFGEKLLNYALAEVRRRGGISAGIAVIDENKRLKDWYIRHGFIEEGTKIFAHLPFTVCFMSREL